MQLLVKGSVRMPWKFSFENHGRESVAAMACYLGYRAHTREEIRWSDTEEANSPLKILWNHIDMILCCSLKPAPTCTFGSNVVLDMLEMTLVNLLGISLEVILDD